MRPQIDFPSGLFLLVKENVSVSFFVQMNLIFFVSRGKYYTGHFQGQGLCVKQIMTLLLQKEEFRTKYEIMTILYLCPLSERSRAFEKEKGPRIKSKIFVAFSRDCPTEIFHDARSNICTPWESHLETHSKEAIIIRLKDRPLFHENYCYYFYFFPWGVHENSRKPNEWEIRRWKIVSFFSFLPIVSFGINHSEMWDKMSL